MVYSQVSILFLISSGAFVAGQSRPPFSFASSTGVEGVEDVLDQARAPAPLVVDEEQIALPGTGGGRLAGNRQNC